MADPIVEREILRSLWKVHVLHHAAQHPIVGNWMLEELRSHGYNVSPGTLYPLLQRMEKHGWLTSEKQGPGLRAPRAYTITDAGVTALAEVRVALGELRRELPENTK